MLRFVALAAAVVLASAASPTLAQGIGPGGGFGPLPALAAPANVPVLPLELAVTRARQYLVQFQNADLVPVEILEFAAVFYVVVGEKSTGKAAFALLVDRVNGNVSSEMGPPRMWNTKYGAWAGAPGIPGPGTMGPGMMGPGMMGRGMMGPGYGPGIGPRAQASPGARAALDEPKARAALQTWINQAFPGAGIGKVVEYPGFFTYRLTRDSRVFALASVSAYSGQVWYAWRYGNFVREQVVR